MQKALTKNGDAGLAVTAQAKAYLLRANNN
jgi:hypothetical protein